MAHFQLVVPNYDNAGSADNPPLTYVRLGQAWQTNETLSVANRADSLLMPSADLPEGHLHFKDDARAAAPARTKPDKVYRRDDGVTETTSTAAALTAELLTRGGVREHTDGDRISTTRGDHLAVVFGNYKLAIMGRVEGPKVGRSWWESSGGHNHDSTSTPGEVSTISWTASHEDGTWEVLEETEKGEQWSYYQGRQESTFYGPTKSETIGATVPPAIKDKTYCQKKTALEVYDTKTDTTVVNGDVTEHTQVTTLKRDALFYKGGKTVEDTTVTDGTFSSHLLALPLITSQTAFAAHYEKYGGDFTTKLTIGADFSVTVGAATTFRVGHMAIPITLADTLEITVAASLALEIGLTGKIVCIHKMETGMSDTELTLMDLRVKVAEKRAELAQTRAGLTDLQVNALLAQP